MGLELNFLGLSASESDFDSAKTVIVPVPYERTVSFRGGCSAGPLAIMEASRSIELYDDELECSPSESGIHTLCEVECDIPPESMAERVKAECLPSAERGKFVVTVGGEHSVTAGAFSAQREIHPDLSVVSIDAHCDLRDTYQGSKLSHACVMRRVAETGATVVEAGVRSMSSEEAEFLRENPAVSVFRAADITGKDPVSWSAEIVEKLGEKVYLSIDLDGLDPSIMPSVGTPEPGGLAWTEVTALMRALFSRREVVAMDVVELSPVPGMCAPDVTAAKLIYKAVGYKFARLVKS